MTAAKPRKATKPPAKKATAKRATGRPSRCTPALTELICSHIADGLGTDQACELVGIGTATLRTWRAAAEPDHPRHHARYVAFATALTRATLLREKQRVASIQLAGLKDWRATLALLERQHPERWSLKHLVELTGKDGGALEVAAKVERLPLAPEDAADTVGALVEAGVIAADASPAQVAAALASLGG